MQVIHFREGAGTPFWGGEHSGVSFISLLHGTGHAHVPCLHLAKGARIDNPGLTHDDALLVVQGRVFLSPHRTGAHLRLPLGVGMAMRARERFDLWSAEGGVAILIECSSLEATDVAISTPQRISGQR